MSIENPKQSKWQKPNWDELIPEAKSDFRCGYCDKMKPWQDLWQSTRTEVCAICDSCKKKAKE